MTAVACDDTGLLDVKAALPALVTVDAPSRVGGLADASLPVNDVGRWADAPSKIFR